MTSILLYSIDSLDIYDDKYVKKYDIVRGKTDKYSITNYDNYVVWKFISCDNIICTACYFKKAKKVYVVNESFNTSNHIVYRGNLMIFVPVLQKYKIHKKDGTCISDGHSIKDLSNDPKDNIYAALWEINYDRVEYGNMVYTKNMINE